MVRLGEKLVRIENQFKPVDLDKSTVRVIGLNLLRPTEFTFDTPSFPVHPQ